MQTSSSLSLLSLFPKQTVHIQILLLLSPPRVDHIIVDNLSESSPWRELTSLLQQPLIAYNFIYLGVGLSDIFPQLHYYVN